MQPTGCQDLISSAGPLMLNSTEHCRNLPLRTGMAMMQRSPSTHTPLGQWILIPLAKTSGRLPLANI
ncbi:hypothetical protein SLA2020_288860 [Shorea laevis]